MPDDRTRKTDATKKIGASHSSYSSSQSSPGFIPPHGGYDNLLGYRKSQIIYDATVCFCDRFIDKRSRTHDQMVQAARSGNKNIAEGSQVSGTSKESETHWCCSQQPGGTPRRLQRLPPARGFREWDKNDREALYVRKLGARNDERLPEWLLKVAVDSTTRASRKR